MRTESWGLPADADPRRAKRAAAWNFMARWQGKKQKRLRVFDRTRESEGNRRRSFAFCGREQWNFKKEVSRFEEVVSAGSEDPATVQPLHDAMRDQSFGALLDL